MNAMKYKGYAARIEFDADDRIFVGHLAGIRDIVGFHGSSVAELEIAFHEAVDDYLAACQKLGQQPHKPASGKLLLRVPPEIHSAAIMAAESEGKSLNQWATHVLEEAVQYC
jgi:predicted HicB family RNase H-like nuclease